MDALDVRRLREATIGAAHDVFTADQSREAHQPLGDQFWMLDNIGGVADHARNELMAGRQFCRLPYPPFVLVARIGHLDAVTARFDAQHEIDNVFQRNVG